MNLRWTAPFCLMVMFCLTTNIWAQNANKKGFHYLMPTKTANEICSLNIKIEKVFHMMLGEFTNKAQLDTLSQRTAGAVEQHRIAVPIWTDRKGEYWLYSGWFKAGQPERALIQSVFRVAKEGRDTFRVFQYRLPREVENNYYAEEWKKADAFADLKPKDLIPDTSCAYYIIEKGENHYQMNLYTDPCFLPLNEHAQYFSLRLDLTPETCVYAMNFLTKDKTALPKATETAVFDRVSRDTPTYIKAARKVVGNR